MEAMISLQQQASTGRLFTVSDLSYIRTCFITGMIWTSPHQALKSVEAGMQEHVIGTGLNHLVSKQHLELRMAAFEYFHRQYASFLHSSSVDALIPPPAASYVSQCCFVDTRVTTHLENLEKSGNSKVVREKSGKMEKVRGSEISPQWG